MNKLEETNKMIDYIAKVSEVGLDLSVVNPAILADIAKSLTMIADKLCKDESEDKE